VRNRLLVVLLSVVVDNVEELELVNTTGGGNDAEPVTELVLLEELLGTAEAHVSSCFQETTLSPLWRSGGNVQVLDVPTRELVVGNDLDLAVGGGRDLDGLAKVADTALNLDLLVQELLEGGDIEDLVGGRARSVDNELLGDLGALLGTGLLLLYQKKNH
jgi:hypothetical protein